MMTIENAINRLEDIVSGCYKKKFPKSKLRRNTEEAVKLIRFDFMTMSRINNPNVKLESFTKIVDIVLDDTLMASNSSLTYKEYCKNKAELHTIMKYPDVIDECINCCDVIQKRISEGADIIKNDTMSVQKLSKKYYHKYLYFKDDLIGSQYVWVKNIHLDEEGHFQIDGVMLYTDIQKSIFGLKEIENFPVEDFNDFGDPKNPFTKCEDLDEALKQPIDRRLKSHIVTLDEVAEDILFVFTLFNDIHLPPMGNLLKSIRSHQNYK